MRGKESGNGPVSEARSCNSRVGLDRPCWGAIVLAAGEGSLHQCNRRGQTSSALQTGQDLARSQRRCRLSGTGRRYRRDDDDCRHRSAGSERRCTGNDDPYLPLGQRQQAACRRSGASAHRHRFDHAAFAANRCAKNQDYHSASEPAGPGGRGYPVSPASHDRAKAEYRPGSHANAADHHAQYRDEQPTGIVLRFALNSSLYDCTTAGFFPGYQADSVNHHAHCWDEQQTGDVRCSQAGPGHHDQDSTADAHGHAGYSVFACFPGEQAAGCSGYNQFAAASDAVGGWQRRQPEIVQLPLPTTVRFVLQAVQPVLPIAVCLQPAVSDAAAAHRPTAQVEQFLFLYDSRLSAAAETGGYACAHVHRG